MVARLAPPHFSGAGRQAFVLSRWLAGHGVDVDLVTLSIGGRKAEVPGGCRVFRWPAPADGLRRQKLMLAIGTAAALLLRRYDIVHVHGSFFVLRLLRVLRPLCGFHVVYKPTMVGVDDADAIVRLRPTLLSTVDRWACISDTIAASARRAGAMDETIVKVTNGVDTHEFRPASHTDRLELRRRLGLPLDRPVWVTVGAIITRKRPDLVIRAWMLLKSRKALLLVVGPSLGAEPAYEAEVAELARTRSGSVRLLGERTDIAALLRAADGFVFASDREGLPNAVLEALAVGLPVVSTPFEGVEDLRALAPMQLEVTAADPTAIAAAIETSGGFVPQRSHILDRVGIDAVGARYVDVYESLIARPSEVAGVSHA
jgi:glycosyltransferase involved in cell wall biosynthesis